MSIIYEIWLQCLSSILVVNKIQRVIFEIHTERKVVHEMIVDQAETAIWGKWVSHGDYERKYSNLRRCSLASIFG